jgi:RecA-family ATPase
MADKILQDQPAAPPFPPARPTRIDIAAAFSTTPKPLDFVLPGMLAGTVGALVSPGGAGKSMLALQLAALIAGGADLAGFDAAIPHGRVVILAAEDPAEALQHRLHALGGHLDASQRELVAESVDIMPLLGYGFDVMTPEWFDWMLEKARGTRLLIVDTLRRIHTMDENDSGHMAGLLAQLERIVHLTGCTILFLHHSSKAAAMQGQGDVQQASRGSSVLVDNIRWQSYMATMNRDEATKYGVDEDRRGFFVRWGVSKQNYGKPISECWLQRHEGGVLLPASLKAGSSSRRAKGAFNE